MSTTAKRADGGPLHDVRFPNEPPEYRAARDALLRAEMDLRRHTEQVAAMRRALPPGGVVPEDYVFEEGGATLDDVQTTRRVRLSELFGPHATLVAYSFMFGPDMERPCPMCTAMLDSLNGSAEHISQRVALAVIAKSPIARIREFARSRGWSGLRLLSSAGSSYNTDYHGEGPDGAQWPSLNVFVRSNGAVRHFYNAELHFAPREPGQHPRHVDPIWPLWNVLDLTPDGRGRDWLPQLQYPR